MEISTLAAVQVVVFIVSGFLNEDLFSLQASVQWGGCVCVCLDVYSNLSKEQNEKSHIKIISFHCFMQYFDYFYLLNLCHFR